VQLLSERGMSRYIRAAIEHSRRRALIELAESDPMLRQHADALAEAQERVDYMRAAVAEYDAWLEANPEGAA
jgi:hypothetical protein